MLISLALALAAAAAPVTSTQTPAAAPTSKPSPPSKAAARAAALRERAAGAVSWDVVSSLTAEVGPRPTGSDGMRRAKSWAEKKLTSLGFTHVHAEPFVKANAWLRGPEALTMTAPYGLPLAVIGLGNSPGTVDGGVEADVVVFDSLEALIAAPVGSLTGKIALVNQPMVRTESGEGYGVAVRARGRGPALAAERGAVAFLTRSIATGDGRAPHTGASGSGAAVPIPAAAVGVADADLLARLAARGPVRVTLSLTPTVLSTAEAWNISGEIAGRDPNAGVVVLGAHLDSWDPGEGALDDGVGVAIVVGVARLIKDLPPDLRPARTVRVVLFGSEETGGSSDAYAAAHAAEFANVAVAAEADSGGGRIVRVLLPKNAVDDGAFAGLATALAPLRVFVSKEVAAHAGSDVEGLQAGGVPVVEVDSDVSAYFDVHHSADDTLDKVNRDDLDQVVAAWSVVVAYLADASVDLRAIAAR